MPSTPPKRPNVTSKLDSDERRTLIIPAFGTFDTRFDVKDVIYHPVPSSYAATGTASVWRVLLKFGETGRRVVAGLDVYSDTVFGRGSDEPESPDIDLTNLGALERGVSRIHALLRPTPHNLYLIDLKSTNGTFVNAIPLNRGTAQAIRNHDGVAFAGLTCVVEIVSSPSYPIELPPPETSPADIEATLKIGKPKTGTETIFGVKLELPPKPDDPDLH